MKNMDQYFFIKNAPPAFVLNNCTPEDVGRAMIENGLQMQPFFIFDMDEAFRRIQHFRDLMPRVKIFYAMKANDTEMFLKFAISQGTNFACASPGEIYKIRKVDVNPNSIIYSMATKTPEQMNYARETGVKHTTFDTSIELKKLVEHWPDTRLLIHVRVNSDCPTNHVNKFGCDFETEAITLLEEAANFGLKVVGVAFHVGSMHYSSESYVIGLKYAKALFDHEARAGRGMKIIDIGGGFSSDNIDELSTLINACLGELFPDPNIQVIAELGRYLCDSAFTLYCSINNVRTTLKDGKLMNMVFLNDGIYGALRFSEQSSTVSKFKLEHLVCRFELPSTSFKLELQYCWFASLILVMDVLLQSKLVQAIPSYFLPYNEKGLIIPIKQTTEQDTGELEETVLWGPSCDPADRVMANIHIVLPRCSALDWLIFQNIGAYSITFSSKFSCLETPLIRPVVSTELWNMIKDRDVFSPHEFIVNPDISSPLPVTLPPLPSANNVIEHSHTPTLKL